jgi:hypothetical protein
MRTTTSYITISFFNAMSITGDIAGKGRETSTTKITISPLAFLQLKIQPRWQRKAHNLVAKQGEDLQRTAGPMPIKEPNAVLPNLFMLF